MEIIDIPKRSGGLLDSGLVSTRLDARATRVYAALFLAVPVFFAVYVWLAPLLGLADDNSRVYNSSMAAARHIGLCAAGSPIGPKAVHGKSHSLAENADTVWSFTNMGLLSMLSTGGYNTFTTCVLTVVTVFTGAGLELQVGFWFLDYASVEVGACAVPMVQ
jgi:hypothetical protein